MFTALQKKNMKKYKKFILITALTAFIFLLAFTLYTPNQGLFPKYAGGLYNIDNGKNLIISRGLSFNPIMPRIFNKAELVWVYF